MRLRAEGGTDGATIVLFWPDTLPDDADRQLQDGPIELFEQLDAEGKLIYFPCDGDGHYFLSVFVGEDLPPDLEAACKEHKRYPTLTAAGEGYFGGGECAFKRDDAFLRKYPHQAGKLTIPAGKYAATVYQKVAGRNAYAKWSRDRVGPAGKRVERRHNVLFRAACTAVLATLVGLCAFPWVVKGIVAALAAALVVSVVLVRRTASYKAAAAAWNEFANVYPDYVLHLQ
jgi:hypothetical protein